MRYSKREDKKHEIRIKGKKHLGGDFQDKKQ